LHRKRITSRSKHTGTDNAEATRNSHAINKSRLSRSVDRDPYKWSRESEDAHVFRVEEIISMTITVFFLLPWG